MIGNRLLFAPTESGAALCAVAETLQQNHSSDILRRQPCSGLLGGPMKLETQRIILYAVFGGIAAVLLLLAFRS